MPSQYSKYPAPPASIAVPVSIANGGTGATTAPAALNNLDAANQQLSNLSGTVAPNLQVGFLSGSVGTPSLSFQGDLTTGFYRSAASQISVALNGSEAMRVLLSQFGGGIIFSPSELGGISSGLPATAPAAFNATIAAASSFYNPAFCAVGANGTYGQFFAFSSRGSLAAPAATQSGDLIGNLSMAGWGGIAGPTNGYMFGTGIGAVATETFTPTHGGSRLVLSTTPNGATSQATALILDQNGDVLVAKGDVLLSSTSNLKFPASGGAKGYAVDSTNAISIDVSGRSLADTGEDVAATWDNGNAQLTITQFGAVNQSPQIQSASVAVGSLVKKMQVYDENGTLLGYIPIYSSIT